MSKVVDVKTKEDNKVICLLGNLLIVGNGLNKFLVAPQGINASAYFAIKTILDKIKSDFDTFSDSVDTLNKKYCKYDADKKPVMNDDGTYEIKPSMQDKFNTEYNELANTRIEYDFKKISISKINDMPINAYTASFFKE